jgi:hypothetical protein
MTTDAAAPAVANARSPASPPSKSTRAVAAEFVKPIPIIGALLAKMIEEGAWGLLLGLLWIVWAFFVYPLVLPLIASTWINAGVLSSARPSYIEPVRRAFGAKEFADGVARESNRRLDYVQAIEYDQEASRDKTTYLRVEQNQRVVYRVEEVRFSSEDKVKCPMPAVLNSQNATLYTLLAEDIYVADIRNGTPDAHSLTQTQWKSIADKGGPPDRLMITVRPVPALANLSCGKLKVHMSILFEVYKDLVGVPT